MEPWLTFPHAGRTIFTYQLMTFVRGSGVILPRSLMWHIHARVTVGSQDLMRLRTIQAGGQKDHDYNYCASPSVRIRVTYIYATALNHERLLHLPRQPLSRPSLSTRLFHAIPRSWYTCQRSMKEISRPLWHSMAQTTFCAFPTTLSPNPA